MWLLVSRFLLLFPALPIPLLRLLLFYSFFIFISVWISVFVIRNIISNTQTYTQLKLNRSHIWMHAICHVLQFLLLLRVCNGETTSSTKTDDEKEEEREEAKYEKTIHCTKNVELLWKFLSLARNKFGTAKGNIILHTLDAIYSIIFLFLLLLCCVFSF